MRWVVPRIRDVQGARACVHSAMHCARTFCSLNIRFYRIEMPPDPTNLRKLMIDSVLFADDLFSPYMFAFSEFLFYLLQRFSHFSCLMQICRSSSVFSGGFVCYSTLRPCSTPGFEQAGRLPSAPWPNHALARLLLEPSTP